MTLQQLRYFLAACRHGSFAAAADSLYLAQPSLADQIRRLEGELGVKLFTRGARRLVLTEAGQILRPHAERVLSAADVAASAVKDAKELRGGHASLGTFGVAYRYMVEEVVAEFVARYPDVSVRVAGLNTNQVLEAIRERELEAGLVTLPIDTTGLVVQPTMTDENLYAAVEGPDVEQPMTIERLAETRLIVYDSSFGWRDPTRKQLLDRARDAAVELPVAIEVEHLESALGLASKGFGGTYVLQTLTREASFPENLRVVSFKPPLYDTFAFVWRRGEKPSPATRELVRMAQLEMKRFNRPVLPPTDPEEAGEA